MSANISNKNKAQPEKHFQVKVPQSPADFDNVDFSGTTYGEPRIEGKNLIVPFNLILVSYPHCLASSTPGSDVPIMKGQLVFTDVASSSRRLLRQKLDSELPATIESTKDLYTGDPIIQTDMKSVSTSPNQYQTYDLTDRGVFREGEHILVIKDWKITAVSAEIQYNT